MSTDLQIRRLNGRIAALSSTMEESIESKVATLTTQFNALETSVTKNNNSLELFVNDLDGSIGDGNVGVISLMEQVAANKADNATQATNIALNTAIGVANDAAITLLQTSKQDILTETSDVTVNDIVSHGEYVMKNSSGDTIFEVIDASVFDARMTFYNAAGQNKLSISGSSGNLIGSLCTFYDVTATHQVAADIFFTTGVQSMHTAACTRKDYVDDLIFNVYTALSLENARTDNNEMSISALQTENASQATNIALNTAIGVANDAAITLLQTSKQDILTETSDVTVNNITLKNSFNLINPAGKNILSIFDSGEYNAALKMTDGHDVEQININGNTGQIICNTISAEYSIINTYSVSPLFVNTLPQSNDNAACTRKDYVDDNLSLKQDTLIEDSTPTLASTNFVNSGNIFNALDLLDKDLTADIDTKQNKIEMLQWQNNSSFPTGGTQWLEHTKYLILTAGEKIHINCTWGFYRWGENPNVTNACWININGWRPVGGHYFYINNGNMHISNSTAFVYTVPINWTGNITIMLRTDGGYTDAQSRGNVTTIRGVVN